MDRYATMDAVANFPLGYRFVPTDQELIEYLKKKINKEPMGYDVIPNVNIYNHSPQELADRYRNMGENVWYFYTSRDRKYQNGKRPNRSTGNGYWKATIGDKPIYDDHHVPIGFKKTLVFCPLNAKKTDWIMHEYVLNHPDPASRQHVGMLLDDCVLCRIYKRTRGASNLSASCSQITELEQEAVCRRQPEDHARYEHEERRYNLDPVQQHQQIILPPQHDHHHLPMQQNYSVLPTSNQENRLQYLWSESWDKWDWQQLLNLANGISTSES